MASITIQGTSPNGTHPYCILNVTQGTQSIEGNYTTVYWELVLHRPMKVTSSASKSWKVSVGGKNWSGTYTVGGSGSKNISSGSVTVYHNSSGAGSVSFSGTVEFGLTWSGTSYGTYSGSGSMTLSTIPRVSDLTINKTSVPADGSTTVTATATKKSSGFTDTITVSLGEYSKTVTSGTAFTIPASWINAISGESGIAKVTVTTKSGETVIGSRTVELTVTVPDSVVPSISSITISEAVMAVSTAFGLRFVKGLTKLNVEVDASGIYGSTIKSYSTEIEGVKYTGQTFQSNVLLTYGTITVKTTVTDSRGRSKEYTKNTTVIDYDAPVLTDIAYTPCNSDGTANSAGTYTKVTIKGKVSSVDSQNTRKLTLKYKRASASSYSQKTVSTSSYEFTASTIISGTSPDETWEFVAELSDKINGPVSIGLSTGKPVISRRAGGTGVTFGAEAEHEGVVIAKGWELWIDDQELEAIWEERFGQTNN